MTGREYVERLISNLRALGARKLFALGAVGLVTITALTVGAAYLAQPQRSVLYTGLDREDVTRIGNVLADQNIAYDVNADGTAVLVDHTDTAAARMLLAENGLPRSPNAGYELFDDMSSFGLTSFMQEVTRVRALEGELARTIQAINGVTAARVHLVMSDRGSFRRQQQPASASVMIRSDNATSAETADAIRHLVASAIPGMEIGSVTVLDTRGAVLASGDDPANQSTGRLSRLQQETNTALEEKIRRTLVPFLGVENFTASVTSRLNIDKTTENETIFDAENVVPRSVRTIRETRASTNSSLDDPVTVQQNVPQEELPEGGEGAQASENVERREEIANNEIPTRIVQRVRDGFAIEQLSVAVLINQDQLVTNAATDNGRSVEEQVAQIEALVRTAAGFSEARGDQLQVSAVPFAPDATSLEPLQPQGVLAIISNQLGTVINALLVLVVATLMIWFGLRPAVKALTAKPERDPINELLQGPDGEGVDAPEEEELSLIDGIKARLGKTPQARLEQVVDYDEEKAAELLKQWLLQGQKA